MSAFPRSNFESPGSAVDRRLWLRHAGAGFGSLALAWLDSRRVARGEEPPAVSTSPLAARPPHFPPRVRRIIFLFMHGGPSHVDLLDPKPDLVKLAGQPLPESFGPVMTRRKVAANPLLPPVRPFRPRGESGLEISDFLPEIARCADELCVIRSCHGNSVNHPQSVYEMNTGSVLTGRPSAGSWVTYGLGAESDELPAFVVLPDPGGGVKGGPPAWGSGYLPAAYQGTLMRPGANPLLDLHPAGDATRTTPRAVFDLTRQFNQRHWEDRQRDDELAARIAAYELAFRMQAAAPELVDMSRETPETLQLYGIGARDTTEFGTRCLLARRLIERGVRFVQLYAGDTNGWDAHSNVAQNHDQQCRRTDRPIAGLLGDLRRRGLLDETLVIWAGEFGRMPMSEHGAGRDHNPWGYSMWLAGGGVKKGFAYGTTDAVGLRAEQNKVPIHDLHATILHLLGLDHEALTYFHNGREQRLTEVAGHVVHDILS